MSDILNEVVTRFIWDTAGAGEGAEKLREALKKVIEGHKDAKDGAKDHKEELMSMGKIAEHVGGQIVKHMGVAAIGLTSLAAAGTAAAFVLANKLSKGIDETEEKYKKLYDTTNQLGKQSANIRLAPDMERAGENLTKLRESYKKLYEEQEKLLPDFARPGQNFEQRRGVGGYLREAVERARYRLSGTSLEEEEHKISVLQNATLKDIERSKRSIVEATRDEAELSAKVTQGDEYGARNLQNKIDKAKELAELTKIEEESDTKMPEARANIEEKYRQRDKKVTRDQNIAIINAQISSSFAMASNYQNTEDRISASLERNVRLTAAAANHEQDRAKKAERTAAMYDAIAARDQFLLQLAERRNTIGAVAASRRIGVALAQASGNPNLTTEQQERLGYTGGINAAHAATVAAQKNLELEEKKYGKGKASLETQEQLNNAVAAEATARAVLQRYEMELQRTRALSLADAKATTQELRLQVMGRADLAKFAKDENAYQKDMTAFRLSGDRTGAAERTRQRELEREQSFYDTFGDKNDSQIARILIRNRRTEERRSHRRTRYGENHGLLNVRRDMAGRVIGGFNPLTGQQEDHSADPLGGIEQGLHSGGVQGAVGLMGPHSNSMATKVDSGFSAFERQMLEYVQKIANKEGLN